MSYNFKSLKPQIFSNKLSAKSIKADFLAGLNVGIVAIPLSLAFGIQSGASPSIGLIAAIIAGFCAVLFSGSKYQVSGPTAAFVATILTISTKYGYGGLMQALFLSGIILIILGFLRAGSLIKYVVPSIVAGFTAGIAVGLATGQIPDFLGMQITNFPIKFIGRIKALFSLNYQINFKTLIVGITSFCVIIFFPKRAAKIFPPSLAAIIVALLLNAIFPLNAQTLGEKYGDINLNLSFKLPFYTNVFKLLPAAFEIAFLCYIVSLLSARVGDSLSGEAHLSNAEIVAQGITGIICAVFGIIPTTGAVARTGVNIKAGAKSQLSSFFHSLVILIVALFFVKVLMVIPLAALAAILFAACRNMINVKTLKIMFKTSFVQSSTFVATLAGAVFISLTASVLIGLVWYYGANFIVNIKNKDKAN